MLHAALSNGAFEGPFQLTNLRHFVPRIRFVPDCTTWRDNRKSHYSTNCTTRAETALGCNTGADTGEEKLGKQENSKLVALDVEYAHFERLEDGFEVRYPAEVCIVDWDGRDIFHSYCSPGEAVVSRLRWKGGVHGHLLATAPSIQNTAEKIICLLSGCRVIGHGLKSDLDSLGVSRPARVCRDLMHHSVFQRRSGHAMSLKLLARKYLGKTIHVGGRAHSAREDAVTTMSLYRRFVEGSPEDVTVEIELVDMYLTELLQYRALEPESPDLKESSTM